MLWRMVCRMETRQLIYKNLGIHWMLMRVKYPMPSSTVNTANTVAMVTVSVSLLQS